MTALGPSDPLRSAGVEILPLARRAADAGGVTRLAELTRLDRLGLPVWQAVRPLSRALSVHQGKGATDAEAQLGALLEAVESHQAENVAPNGPICRVDALPEPERPSCLARFARDDADPPPTDCEYRWAQARRMDGSASLVPFDCVSLDFTCGIPSPFERSSNGQAAGASRGEAVAVALQERIERDAVAQWRRRSMAARMADMLRLDSVPFGWLALWRERLAQAGVMLGCYRVLSVTGSPVFVCELNDLAKAAPYRAVWGSGCHPLPEIALFRALAEALQSRVTLIAGAREDINPADFVEAAGAAVAFGLPPPPGLRKVEWGEIAPGPAGESAIAEALALAGHAEIAIVDLGAPPGFHLVKAFVGGLAAERRGRQSSAR